VIERVNIGHAVSDLFWLQFSIEGLYKGRVLLSISCCFSPKFWDIVQGHGRSSANIYILTQIELI
jgi:hypothetical protein